MKIIKSLKSDRSLSSLSTNELKTVKGGSGTGSWNPWGRKNPNDDVVGDPPPEIDSHCRYKFI